MSGQITFCSFSELSFKLLVLEEACNHQFIDEYLLNPRLLPCDALCLGESTQIYQRKASEREVVPMKAVLWWATLWKEFRWKRKLKFFPPPSVDMTAVSCDRRPVSE